MIENNKTKKVGIAFGGGGARGFAHIGVIRALYESGIKFDHVAGCSAGSVAAAMYCTEMKYEDMYDAMKKLKKEDFLSSKLFFMPSDPKKVEETVHTILGEKDDFEKCTTPYAVLAVDIVTGLEYVFKHGSLSKAVSASCAVPGLFSPVVFDDMMLMDGSLMNTIPATLLRDLGCDSVVSVTVSDLSTPIAKGTGLIDVLLASVKILMRSNSMKGIKAGDIVIEPNTANHKFSKIGDVDALIEEGYRAAMRVMPQIKRLFE